ncbi:MAG: hypothetical protein AUJ52_07760 [Elusimicrobia bacterium CG1_02_63_36]|nr:MAG: hypothetical protein AUJ52_07760 [Elusimicrobia bacterium CG1_02_63_36]
MKKITTLTALAIGLAFGAPNARGEEIDHEVTVGAQYYGIMKDEGRFREDWFQADKFRGGIESLHFDSERFDMNLKALGHDEYKIKSRFKKEDLGYVLLEGQWARRYFDGSNESWDPKLYNLTGAEAIPDNTTTPPGTIDDGFYSSEDFADRGDKNLYADRMDMTLELGLRKPGLPDAAIGWHRWSRFGKELLLRGERVRNPGVMPELRAVAALSKVDGVSDLFYFDVSGTIDERHTLRARHEAEYYRDSQTSDFPRYKQVGGAGAINQYRTFQDDPKFKSHVSLVSIDSQISEDTLVSGGAMAGYLKNESSREVIRPDQATFGGRNHSIATVTKNLRKNYAGSLGVRKNRVAGIKDLSVIAGARVERIDTDSSTNLLAKGVTPRQSLSSFDENRFLEDLEVRFRGWEKTEATLRVRLEQRNIDQVEWADLGNHEMFDPAHYNSGIQFHDYKAGITHRNEEYGLKLVNRSLPVKLTGGFKYKQKDRNYNVTQDADPRFYPGRIGNLASKTKELALGMSRMFGTRGTAALDYSFRLEDVTSGAANDGRVSDWSIHRVAGNWGGSPSAKAYLMATLIYEKYQLNTPVNITTPASDWAQGTAAYDYQGDFTTGLLNAEYDFTGSLKGSADYQLTDTLGPNGYLFQRGGVGVSYMLSKATTLGLGAELFSFEDHGGSGGQAIHGGYGGFDDYRGYGIKTSYSYRF